MEDCNAVAGIVHDTTGAVSPGALVVAVPAAFDPTKDTIQSSDSVRTDSNGKFTMHLSFASAARLWIRTISGDVASVDNIVAGAKLENMQCADPTTMSVTVPGSFIGSTLIFGIIGTPYTKTISVTDSLILLTDLAPLANVLLFYVDSASGSRTVVTDSLEVSACGQVFVSADSVQWTGYTLPGVTSGANAVLMQGDTLVFGDSTGIRRFKLTDGKFTQIDAPYGTAVFDLAQFGSQIAIASGNGLGFCDGNGTSRTSTSFDAGSPLSTVTKIAAVSDTMLFLLTSSGTVCHYGTGDGRITSSTVGISAIASDRSGSAFCVGATGLFSMTTSGAPVLTQDTRPNVPANISHMAISSGDIWAAPTNGLFKLGPAAAVDFSKGNSAILNDTLNDLKVTSGGSLWMIGAGGTAEVYNAGSWRLFSSLSSPLSITCRPSALAIENSTGWISTSDGRIFHVKAKGFN